MIVYVAYNDRGYEGCSEPLAIFDCPEKAKLFQAGSQTEWNIGVKMKEMELNKVDVR